MDFIAIFGIFSNCNRFNKKKRLYFVGPHTLAKAYRMVADLRDDQMEKRLEKYI